MAGLAVRTAGPDDLVRTTKSLVESFAGKKAYEHTVEGLQTGTPAITVDAGQAWEKAIEEGLIPQDKGLEPIGTGVSSSLPSVSELAKAVGSAVSQAVAAVKDGIDRLIAEAPKLSNLTWSWSRFGTSLYNNTLGLGSDVGVYLYTEKEGYKNRGGHDEVDAWILAVVNLIPYVNKPMQAVGILSGRSIQGKDYGRRLSPGEVFLESVFFAVDLIPGAGKAASAARSAAQPLVRTAIHNVVPKIPIANRFYQPLIRLAERLGFEACFAAGTPLRTPDGSQLIEQIRPGDYVLCRDENDSMGPVESKLVGEIFVKQGLVLELTIGGQIIRTTAEHPFYVYGQGWTAAQELHVGVQVLCEDGTQVAIERVRDTGSWETLYNLRVADHHTYFVGSEKWGFAVWSHNQNGLCKDAEEELVKLTVVTAGRATTALKNVQRSFSGIPTEAHHPFFRMFLRAMEDAGYNVRDAAGRMVSQSLAYWDRAFHQNVHGLWNKFVEEKGFPFLRAIPKGGDPLAKALEDKVITPQKIIDLLAEFYSRPDIADGAAWLSLRQIANKLKLNFPT
jgi:hypothetical protein